MSAATVTVTRLSGATVTVAAPVDISSPHRLADVGMKIAIASTALATIVDHAAAALPDEACGIVIGDAGTIAAAVPAANVAATPATAFEIDPATLLHVHRSARAAGRTVIGWYHSHPNGVAEPSPCDAARAVEDGKVWLIAADGVVAAWRVAAGGAVHGRFDPVALDAA